MAQVYNGQLVGTLNLREQHRLARLERLPS